MASPGGDLEASLVAVNTYLPVLPAEVSGEAWWLEWGISQRQGFPGSILDAGNCTGLLFLFA